MPSLRSTHQPTSTIRGSVPYGMASMLPVTARPQCHAKLRTWVWYRRSVSKPKDSTTGSSALTR